MNELKGHEKPVNKTAAIVTSKGFEYVSSKLIRIKESKNPIKLKKIPDSYFLSDSFNDLTGRRRGRLTVLGLSAVGKGWVVRCDCGVYTIRKAKAILNENNEQDRCEECRHLAHLKRNEYRLRTGKCKDINEF